MNTVATNYHAKDKSFVVRQEIIGLRKNLGLSSMQLAKLLKEAKDNHMYIDWGYDSFEAGLADPEISISRTTAYALIQVWETWIESYGLKLEEVSEVPYDKLIMVAPMVTEDNHKEMFENAKSLSRQDLVHMKLEKKANQGLPDFKPYPKFWRCKNCSLWVSDAKLEEFCIGHS